MGACVSRPGNCVGSGGGGRLGGSRRKRIRKRRKVLKKRIPSHLSDRSSDRIDKFGAAALPLDRPFSNPTIRGSTEESWFDSATVLESDWSDDEDEDFQSLPDDGAPAAIVDSPRNSSRADARHSSLSDHSKESPTRNPGLNSDFKEKFDEAKHVSVDEITLSAEETAGHNDNMFDSCGILSNNCLPCLASAVSPIEKRGPTSPSGMKKKAALKLSFKWKEGHPAAMLVSSKTLLQRPLAGSQVPYCPLGKRVPDSWSDVEPGSFRIRGANYFKDKRKEFASNCAAYYPVGLDVFLSQRKINHIARFVELPLVHSSEKLPPLLVVNVQIPVYPAAIFQGETDGEGISFVMYYKLSETFAKDSPAHFQESIKKLIDDEVEKIRGFRTEVAIPFRERLKILGRVVNVDDLPMSAAERKLMHAYNEKPVLSRPQHEFYLGENYFEIDLDMHRFSYISRKGFETFLDRLKLCVLDFGLTIQGNKAEELPELILCCIRLNEIDYVNYQQLQLEETLEDNDE
ncbi:uncharacterized protein LOC127263663 [Andrographis paniculata]|uniref:uncharacterized protein LOC127263663 n=1 Tax=Andrographis paniculata TaxID=175694 RepID=UPI0021E74153|nr:uncharacterized protein LOC127263663 [Andrographis paniculata]XP_051148758.1 uncharacterized protein LOC127263663 [Andrographis paniculata]